MPFTDAPIDAAIDAALATVTHAQLHTGDPGVAGTANVAAGVPRAALGFDSAAGKEVQATATFTPPGNSGPFTHVSLWTASAGGSFNGSEPFDGAESFVNPGTLAVTVTVTGA